MSLIPRARKSALHGDWKKNVSLWHLESKLQKTDVKPASGPGGVILWAMTTTKKYIFTCSHPVKMYTLTTQAKVSLRMSSTRHKDNPKPNRDLVLVITRHLWVRAH